MAANGTFQADFVAGVVPKPRLLVAGGNTGIREQVARILGQECEVNALADGQDPLHLIRVNPPDLLLLSGAGSFDLLRALRSSLSPETVSVIFLAARSPKESGVEDFPNGADDYLLEPFTPNELRARVATHLRMARARRQAAERETALRAEAAAARDRISSILEAMNDGFVALDSEWRITHFNPESERLLGVGRGGALGQNIWQLFPAALETELYRDLLRTARENVSVEMENYYTPWQRWLHIKAMPDPGGGFSLFIADITERKSADDAIRHGEERFRAIVETTPECVKVVASDGTLLQMNSAGLAMIGADRPEDAIGKCVYDLIAPAFRQEFRAFNENICRGNRGSLEYDIIGLKGRLRHMETQAAPLHNPDGATVQLAITRDITDRRRREQAVLLLSAIVDSSDDAIISKDLNGIITSWNLSAQRVFGYTAEETVGRPITILIPPDRLDEEPQILAKLRRGERVDHFETIRRRKDGTLLDIALTISPVKDATGRIIGASKIARDITERKRAERAIEALNAQLTADLAAMTRMQQLSARLVQACDFPQLLDEVLDAAIEITAADMGDIRLLEDGVLRIVSHRGLSAPFLEFFDSLRSGESACQAALNGGERLIVENVADCPLFDAGARQVFRDAGARALQSTPLIGRSGEVLGTFSTHYRGSRRPDDREIRLLDILARLAADLIERRRAEEALRASQARFRQLADAMPQIVWTAQPDGSIDYYNERCYEFTGFEHDKFNNADWETLLHPDDVAGAAGGWLDAVKAGRPYRVECRLWDRRETRWRWFLARALPARGADGAIVKWFGTTTDIDEQKRVEDDLRRLNEDLEQFAYSASHDLQEPLRTIKIYGELLASRYASRLEGEGREFIGFLRAGATRMESLVRDLLAYTQVVRFELPNETIDANQVLVRTISALSGAIKQCGASVISDTLPSVRVDGTHLGQLFQNLIGNAIKYRDPERAPLVYVSGRQENGYYVFSVRDNGIGIADEYKQHIFGLFKRLHTGEEYSGTGIGLAICQRIVERYRGRIWVESEPGTGSTFFFSIPL